VETEESGRIGLNIGETKRRIQKGHTRNTNLIKRGKCTDNVQEDLLPQELRDKPECRKGVNNHLTKEGKGVS